MDGIIKVLLKIFYLFPVKKNRIFFTSYSGKSYSDSPKVITEYLLDNYPNENWELIWECNNPNGFIETSNKPIKLVKHNSIYYFYAMLTSVAVICNITVSKRIPYRSNQHIIDTWHGCGPKRIGKYVKGHNKEDYRMITEFINPNRIHEEKVRDEIEYEGKILNIGYPRNDILFRDNTELRNKILEQYNIRKENGIILYAPTFRGVFEEEKSTIDYSRLIKTAEEKFKKGFTLLYRCHPMVGHELKTSENNSVIDVTDYSDMQDLLAICDILVTDYSSSMWDAIVPPTPKIVFAYTPDIEEFRKNRGLWLDLSQWPFSVSKDNSELEKNIKEFDWEKYNKTVSNFLHFCGNFENGTATASIVRLIRGS